MAKQVLEQAKEKMNKTIAAFHVNYLQSVQVVQMQLY